MTTDAIGGCKPAFHRYFDYLNHGGFIQFIFFHTLFVF